MQGYYIVPLFSIVLMRDWTLVISFTLTTGAGHIWKPFATAAARKSSPICVPAVGALMGTPPPNWLNAESSGENIDVVRAVITLSPLLNLAGMLSLVPVPAPLT